MEFNKAYNRAEFLSFLRTSFLPEDFQQEASVIDNPVQFQYTQQVTRLGECESLGLVVYEVRHSSKHDARVGLTKEAFRLLADEFCERALVFFVPEDDDSNYRFSLIEITLDQSEESSRISRRYSNPHRYSYYLGKGIAYYTPNKYLNEYGRVVSLEDLRNRFSVEVLTKAFYQELSDWYAWAIMVVRFPNDLTTLEDNQKYNSEAMIRLITRLIFVWFLKQRHLVPDEFFDEQFIANELIQGFTPHAETTLFGKSYDSKYYKGVLQNLFFAMLNSPITPEGKDTISERRFRNGRGDYDNNKLMRHEDLFINPDKFVELANKYVPFLNGGLFDCLDDKDKGIYIDAFTDRKVISDQLVIPDFLFFGDEVGKNIDLSEWYGDKKKKKVSARGIIDILKRYNFTVEENTPFDQEVSLDPELLGKVFENLLAAYNPETQTTARKQTGSFYTPREIVQYMVDESLVAHLKRTVGEDLEPEYRKLVQYTDEGLTLTDNQKRQIMQSLYECKVLDPACGSGAFPMGMLQQMVHILGQLDPNNEQWKDMMLNNAISETSEAYHNATDEERAEIVADIERSFNESINRPNYARKLYLIENCIYGVDIQPIAIQISKLRFFISLVVDQKTNNNPVDNFGIRPLPNLEAKFVAANTLIGLQKREANLFDSEAIREKEKELREAKHRIFGAKTVKTKRKYKERVASLRTEIANMLKDCGSIGNNEAQQLSSWDMFDQNATSPFFDSEWMFGVSGGFDIVIANPPYVDAKKLKSIAPDLKCYKVFNGSADLYTYFYELALLVLSDGGTLTYITSNKWIRSEYGRRLRKMFLTNGIVELIDFGRNRLFDATVDTNIIIVNKKSQIAQPVLYYFDENTKGFSLKEMLQNGHVMNVSLSEDAWLLKAGENGLMKSKIESHGVPLKDLGVNIYRGILTGLNKAYHISEIEKERLVRLDPRNADVIHPLICGNDTERFYCKHPKLWIINIHNGIKDKSIKPVDINNFPVIKQRLDSYFTELSERNDKGCTPYNLRNCAYLNQFKKEKIIWQAISKRIAFAYDPNGLYCCDVTTYFMTGNNLKYILAILNSRLFKYALLNIYLEGDTFKSKNAIIQHYPIPPFTIEHLPIVSLVDHIIDAYKENPYANTSVLDNEIDKRVYHLYGLTYDEVLIVDPETPITREEYEKE